MKIIFPKILVIFVFITSVARAEDLVLPNVFSDHMVLQREAPVNIWGKANPNTEVTVEFKNQIKATISDDKGAWILQLSPMPASEIGEALTVKTSSESKMFSDVVMGDVWLCSGQSNMEWALENTVNGDMEIASPEKSMIRIYQVENVITSEPRFSSAFHWQKCEGRSIRRFSAVGYYFGKYIHQVLDVPIGLIDCSWGGTPLVSWVEEETLLKYDHTAKEIEKWNSFLDHYESIYSDWMKRVLAYEEKNHVKLIHADNGISEGENSFSESSFDDAEWKTVVLPSTIERHAGDLDGALWYRRKIELPEHFRNQTLTLNLGTIDDLDVTFVNGVEVGSHSGYRMQLHAIARSYEIPSSVNTEDTMTIAVRVFDEVGGGGFTGSNSSMELVLSESDRIPLGGLWKYTDEYALKPALGAWTVTTLYEPEGRKSPNQPGILAKSMLTTVCPYTLKGAIWYQGEADADLHRDPERYEERLEILLEDWEHRWNQENLPFVIVQLASYMEPTFTPSDAGWPRVRDAQLRFSEARKNVGIAVTIDIGEADDVHPRNKQDVGRRLARWALTDIYGKMNLSGGPLLQGYEITDSSIKLTFRNVGYGLKVLNGGPLKGFTIAGEDRDFHNAKAKILSKNSVEVFSSDVKKPVAVRYAWSENPSDANLVNQQRLPASPFRTDDWEMEEGIYSQ